LRWDTCAEDPFDVDVIPDFLAGARRDYLGLGLYLASGAALPLPNASSDGLTQSTVFTSVLDPGLRRSVASETLRIAKGGRARIWYDFRYPNPRNPEVAPIRRRELDALFPGIDFGVQSVTLLPPLARLAARFSFVACRALEAVPFLRSHCPALGKVPSDALP